MKQVLANVAAVELIGRFAEVLSELGDGSEVSFWVCGDRFRMRMSSSMRCLNGVMVDSKQRHRGALGRDTSIVA